MARQHVTLRFTKSLDGNQQIQYKVTTSNLEGVAVILAGTKAFYKRLTEESILHGLQTILRSANISYHQMSLHAKFNETEYKFSCMIRKTGNDRYVFTENFPEFQIAMSTKEMFLIGKTLLKFAKNNLEI